MSEWLLIADPPLTGAVNMQRDRLLYQQFSEIPVAGILRFFCWSEPTLSLGRFQQDPELEARCQRVGVPWVRRPTGGRAILHGQDLCWSVIAETQGDWGQSILETYQRLSAVFMDALQDLGITACFPETNAPYHQQADCFASLTPADLTVTGKKLLGSAQVRNRRCFLQQSSLAWGQVPEALFTAVLGGDRQKQTALQQLRPGLSQTVWMQALQNAFALRGGIRWRPWDTTMEALYLSETEAKKA